MALTFLLLLLCSTLAYSQAVGNIVGGHLAPENKFPSIISLMARNKPICGGTLINDHQVITAGHCVAASRSTQASPASIFKIRANSLSSKSGGQVIQVKNVTIHPQYNKFGTIMSHVPNDIAILTLAERVTNAKPARLPFDPENETTKGEDVTTAGWGNTDMSNPKGSTMLRWATVQAWDKDTCRTSADQTDIPEDIICAHVEGGGIDSCQGDSGGPLYEANNTLVGIVSNGKGCGLARYPGWYTRVFSHKAFIEENLSPN